MKFTTSDYDILICLIEIWTPADKKKPNGDRSGSTTYITEVENIEIVDSFKQLIGTANVSFPRGTMIRETLTPTSENVSEKYAKVTASVAQSGVVETKRDGTTMVTPSSFSVGQRIRIYLGYTKDPQIADWGKTSNVGKDGKKTIFTDKDTLTNYGDEAAYRPNDETTRQQYKNNLGFMFDGFITKISVDTPIELECENLASNLKNITCPKVKLKKCEVKDLLGDDGRYKLLKDTGLMLHPDTAAMDFNLGGIELSKDLTVADVLQQWSKFGMFCYVGDYNGNPAIQIGRAYFSNPQRDSLLNAFKRKNPYEVFFNYHVASNGLSLTSTDKQFLAVSAKGIDKDDKFINITIIPNPDFDPTKPDSDSNPKYRYVNETKLSKKALKAGKRYLTHAPNDKVDMKLYEQITFSSKKIPITMEELAKEASEYLEGYNMTGIEGSLTLFGDLKLKTADQVKLIDERFPGKNGTYMVEEVHTTFGVDGFRQRITLPYCIQRDGNKDEQK